MTNRTPGKLNGNAGLFGAGDSINTLGKVKEQRGIKEKIQRAARVDIFCRDVEDEPGAEQVDDHENLYEEERNAQRQDFPVQPPGAAVDTEIHEQAPQKATKTVEPVQRVLVRTTSV